jgi:hypothetical protein
MTALKEYQRLECTGLWRDAADGQRVEVIVSFGDATLVISESRSARALTHWSLPAILRLNPGQRPARFAPAEDTGEELEIADEAMIDALAKTHRLIEARRPHPGRLRSGIVVALFAGLAGLGFFWLPAALVRHTAAALPAANRLDIGTAALAELTRLTGQPCQSPEGLAALALLAQRTLGPEALLYVVPDGVDRSLALPGGIVLLSRMLVETADSPEIVAGDVLAASAVADSDDPLLPILTHAGFMANARLLTTGALPQDALKGYGEIRLSTSAHPAADAPLLARFAKAGLSSAPYAWAIDPSGETVLGLIEADPFRGKPSPPPVLTDSEWVALQGICAN